MLTSNQADDAKAEASKAGQKLDAYRNDAAKKLDDARKTTGQELTTAVDKFDQSVSEGAAKSKSWVGSWFGGK